MWRLTVVGVVIGLTLVRAGSAQYSVPPTRMSPDEASVIADYWIRSYLRRAPAPEEHRLWTNQLLTSSPARVLSSLLASEEYYNYAGGTPQGLMRQLIADVGHRDPSPYEVDGRLREMAGQDPRSLAYQFLREHPRNWWPGPGAAPPRELRYFYSRTYWR